MKPIIIRHGLQCVEYLCKSQVEYDYIVNRLSILVNALNRNTGKKK